MNPWRPPMFQDPGLPPGCDDPGDNEPHKRGECAISLHESDCCTSCHTQWASGVDDDRFARNETGQLIECPYCTEESEEDHVAN